jgi:hypothetical protein
MVCVVSFAILQGEAGAGASSGSSRSGSFVRSGTATYRLFAALGTQFLCFDLTFKIASQSYMLNRPEVAGLPSTGFVRTYPACVIVGDDVISGTDSGEIVVYSVTNKIYRTHKRVCYC